MMHAFRSLSVWTVFRAAALLMLLLGFIAGSAAGWIQLLMLGIFVAFLGIPHGAFDPFIAKSRGLWRTAPGLAAFIVVYVGLAIAVIALWILFPVVSLVVFLLISAWHFGADWSPNIVVRCGMGMIILGLPRSPLAKRPRRFFGCFRGRRDARTALAHGSGGRRGYHSNWVVCCHINGPAIYASKAMGFADPNTSRGCLAAAGLFHCLFLCTSQPNARGAFLG